jgi:heme-degrading monooxygenase HmoA
VGKAETDMSVVSVLRLAVLPGSEDALSRAFAELEVFRHSQESGGFLGGRLLRPLTDGPFLVMAEWESGEAYQRWLDNAVREELGAQIEPLLEDDVEAGGLYEDA